MKKSSCRTLVLDDDTSDKSMDTEYLRSNYFHKIDETRRPCSHIPEAGLILLLMLFRNIYSRLFLPVSSFFHNLISSLNDLRIV